MGKIAFVFAGQGAQYSGMGKELYDNSSAAKKIFDTAQDYRNGTINQCFSASKEELSITKNTQPCLFCVDIAAAEALKENGIVPDMVAGFSLGEIPALTFAKAFDFKTGFEVVQKRAELMQKAAEKVNTGMAAILKLNSEVVVELTKKHKNIYAVNFNCPGQIVVAGDKIQLDSFTMDVKDRGGKVVPLAVSGGFHSPFMNEAKEAFKDVLDKITINDPEIPIFSNYTAEVYGENYKELLANQMNHPVLWQKTVENMITQGVDTFIEVGAGKTLSGLIRKISPKAIIYNVEDKESLNKTLEELGGKSRC